MSGPGWVCNVGTLTCTNANVLAAGGSYPDITLTVDVDGQRAHPGDEHGDGVGRRGGQLDVNVTDNDSGTDNVNVRQHTTTTDRAGDRGLPR